MAMVSVEPLPAGLVRRQGGGLEVDADGGQGLADLVVQLPGDAAALALLVLINWRDNASSRRRLSRASCSASRRSVMSMAMPPTRRWPTALVKGNL